MLSVSVGRRACCKRRSDTAHTPRDASGAARSSPRPRLEPRRATLRCTARADVSANPGTSREPQHSARPVESLSALARSRVDRPRGGGEGAAARFLRSPTAHEGFRARAGAGVRRGVPRLLQRLQQLSRRSPAARASRGPPHRHHRQRALDPRRGRECRAGDPRQGDRQSRRVPRPLHRRRHPHPRRPPARIGLHEASHRRPRIVLVDILDDVVVVVLRG